jgi:enamine deaminase RidA (YjgF/YER057c/UK114 family)
MTRLATVRRHHAPPRAGSICDAEATVVQTQSATELYIRCAPLASANSRNGCLRQAQVIYDGLVQLLKQFNADMGHVLIEKAYFRNLAADIGDFQQVRHEAYRKRGVCENTQPAATYLQQPPCRDGQDVELQAYAVVPGDGGHVIVDHLSPSREHVTIKRYEIGQAQHLYVSAITGQGLNGSPLGTFREQSDKMFQVASEVIGQYGLAFPDVLRTWIYLDDIDRDYDALNASRNEFFGREGVSRLPASTGISAGLHPVGTGCSVDVYGLLNPEIAECEIMTTPTLNEAPEYGSAFSRGMKVAVPEQTYLYISGTASVDEKGDTVHVGQRREQMERMLLNIRELLQGQGATFADLAQGVTYLKSADMAELYREVLAEWGVSGFPHSIVEAHVCRPDLLTEMEAIAVIPSDR